MKPIHQRLQLFLDGTASYIFLPSGSSSEPWLSVSRTTGDIVLNEPNVQLPYNAHRSSKAVYGIMGMIPLTLSEYLVIITGRDVVGNFNGHEVYRATNFEILPMNPNVNVHQPSHPVEAHLLALIQSHLRSGSFLFSYEADLSRRLQVQYLHPEADKARALWEVFDDRFFWNKHLQSKFIDATTIRDLSAFILPVLFGTFDSRKTVLHGRHLKLYLISRRSRFRAGTRYFRRGIDSNGHVANFNETEQLVFVEPPNAIGPSEDGRTADKLSFVQIRGSVPLFWAEINTVRYKPDLQIMELQDTPMALGKHLQEQVAIYGPLTLVNLVNSKGYEEPIKEAYERQVSQLDLPDVHYEYFDFHKECSKMRWHRLTLLVDQIQKDLVKQSYFHVGPENQIPKKLQLGTVRTNCMDNLDRTNVSQATIAKWVLNQQLIYLGVLPPDRGVDDYDSFSHDFREMWADHADEISKAYAGSGALKSDFTRTNKRTRKGLLDDGVKSVLRYLKNNYFDGPRQDGFDLVTGNWVPRRNPSSAMFLVTDPRPLIIRSMPPVAFFSVFMICAGLTLPRTSDYSLFYYFLLWLFLLSTSLLFIALHGIDYVSWPKLLPLNEIIYYTGPGYRSAHHGKGIGGGEKLKMGLSQSAKWLNNRKGRTQSRARMEEGDIQMSTLGNKKRVD